MALSMRLNRKRRLLNSPTKQKNSYIESMKLLMEKENIDSNKENIEEIGFVLENLDLIREIPFPPPPSPLLQKSIENEKQAHHLNVWCNIMQDLSKRIEIKLNEHLTLIRVPSRYNQAVNTYSNISKIGSAGDRRLASIRDCLNLLVDERSGDQTIMHDAFIIACLPLIYGKEWESNCIRVMKEHKITRIRSEVLCLTPRRFGKTYAVAMFVTALLLNCPGIILCVFSTGSRASTFMREIIVKMMMRIPGALNRIIKKTAEKLYIAPMDVHQQRRNRQTRHSLMQKPGISELHSFPSSVASKYINKFIKFFKINTYR